SCRKFKTALLCRFHSVASLPRRYITTKVYSQGNLIDSIHSSGILQRKELPICVWSQSRKRGINVPVANTSGCLGLRRSQGSVPSANRHIGTSHARIRISRNNGLAERKGVEPTDALTPVRIGALQAPSCHQRDFSPLKDAGWESASLTFIPSLRFQCQLILLAIRSPIPATGYIRKYLSSASSLIHNLCISCASWSFIGGLLLKNWRERILPNSCGTRIGGPKLGSVRYRTTNCTLSWALSAELYPQEFQQSIS